VNETVEFEIEGSGYYQYRFICAIVLLRPSNKFLVRSNVLIIELQMDEISDYQ
jgi:hypothetical protein